MVSRPNSEFTVYQDVDYRPAISQNDQKALNEVTNIQISHEVVKKLIPGSSNSSI